MQYPLWFTGDIHRRSRERGHSRDGFGIKWDSKRIQRASEEGFTRSPRTRLVDSGCTDTGWDVRLRLARQVHNPDEEVKLDVPKVTPDERPEHLRNVCAALLSAPAADGMVWDLYTIA